VTSHGSNALASSQQALLYRYSYTALVEVLRMDQTIATVSLLSAERWGPTKIHLMAYAQPDRSKLCRVVTKDR
jgi:hypothetical protein